MNKLTIMDNVHLAFGAGTVARKDAYLNSAHEQILQLERENAALRDALKSALQTAKFESHPFRPWHFEAEKLLLQ